MRIDYTGRQLEVSPDLRQYTEERLGKLARVLRDRCDIHVILSAEKHRRIAEITLKWRDHTLVGIEETSDERSSLNGALDKLERQAVRLLEKKRTRKRRPKPTEAVRVNILAGESSNPVERLVVVTQRIPIKPLTLDEAIDDLENASNGIVVFRNSETERVNIIYRRPDGHMTLVEPES
ncbi:MAG: ribosome hibernation-promoting factor, HPF/YfiA family [Terriglobia bacterium]